MATLTSLKNHRYFVVLMGKSFAGKSVLASQFPKPCFIDLDFNLSSITAIRSRMKLNFDFDVIQINEEETTDEDFIKLCGKGFTKVSGWNKVKKLSAVLSKKMPQDSTLIIDGLSRMGEMLRNHIMRITGKEMRIQDWGTFADEMCEFCDDLNSPYAVPNVILIAHEDIVKDELTGAIERVLLVAGKSSARIPSLCSEFWRIAHEAKPGGAKSKRILQVDADRITSTGSRSWLPTTVNPTYEKIKPYLEQTVGRDLPPPTWTPSEDL
jgi:hypothetical protein